MYRSALNITNRTLLMIAAANLGKRLLSFGVPRLYEGVEHHNVQCILIPRQKLGSVRIWKRIIIIIMFLGSSIISIMFFSFGVIYIIIIFFVIVVVVVVIIIIVIIIIHSVVVDSSFIVIIIVISAKIIFVVVALARTDLTFLFFGFIPSRYISSFSALRRDNRSCRCPTWITVVVTATMVVVQLGYLRVGCFMM